MCRGMLERGHHVMTEQDFGSPLRRVTSRLPPNGLFTYPPSSFPVSPILPSADTLALVLVAAWMSRCLEVYVLARFVPGMDSILKGVSPTRGLPCLLILYS